MKRLDTTLLNDDLERLQVKLQATTSVKDKERRRGTTPDRLLQIEVIGPLAEAWQLTVTSLLSPGHEAYMQRNTLVMLIVMGVLFPEWRERDAWLATSLQNVRTRSGVAFQDETPVRLQYVQGVAQVHLIIGRLPSERVRRGRDRPAPGEARA